VTKTPPPIPVSPRKGERKEWSMRLYMAGYLTGPPDFSLRLSNEALIMSCTTFS